MSTRILSLLLALGATASFLCADVITFTNGAVIRGTFLGGDARTIRVEVSNQVQTYRISEVASIVFGDGVAPAAGASSAGAVAGAAMQAAQVQAPAIQAPAIQAPAVQAPAVQAPAVQAPQLQAPQVQAPAIQAPAMQAPQVQAPQVQAPALAAPAVQAPAVQAPAPKRGLFGRKKKQPEEQAAQAPAPQVQAPPVQAPAMAPPPVQAVPVAQAPQPAPAPSPQPAAVAPAPVQANAQAAAPATEAAPSQTAAPVPPAPVPAAAAVATAPEAAAPVQSVPIGGSDGRTIPAGALLRVRLIDSIDSSVHQPGETFRTSLDAALSAAGETLLPKGTDVIVRLAQTAPAGAGARPMFRLEATVVRLRAGNLVVAAEGLPGADPSFVAPSGAGLAKLVAASDSIVTLRVTRAFRVP